eukprot:scaffold15633_cov60-Phaeocystis_antarctica.AAC.9
MSAGAEAESASCTITHETGLSCNLRNAVVPHASTTQRLASQSCFFRTAPQGEDRAVWWALLSAGRGHHVADADADADDELS